MEQNQFIENKTLYRKHGRINRFVKVQTIKEKASCPNYML
jgi:hypothetical protein